MDSHNTCTCPPGLCKAIYKPVTLLYLSHDNNIIIIIILWFFLTAIVCRELNIQDGTTEYSSILGPPFDVGTVANFGCNDGFFLWGNSSSTCVNISSIPQWDNEGPVCQSECHAHFQKKHNAGDEFRVKL